MTMRRAHACWMAIAACMLAACGGSDGEGEDGPWRFGEKLPAAPQAEGDPVLGRELLLEGEYMSCGVPYKLYTDATFGPIVRAALGVSQDSPVLPDRGGEDAALPYLVSAFQTPEGVEVVSTNCLACHGGVIDGQVVVGLGNAAVDFTTALGGPAGAVPDSVLQAAGLTELEIAAFQKISTRAQIIGPATVMRTVGNNPAEQLTAVLLAHHDRQTLAWSDEPLVEFVARDREGNPIADAVLTSDAPPWWRVKKKNALFYNGMARGDHRGTMELATSVCVDSLAQAERVDGWFRHIQAYIATIKAPNYPRSIDAELAGRGRTVFGRDCAGCHGTYADDPDDDAHDTYPNLLIPLDVIRTDPVVAEAAVVHSPELLDWYNGSFYGSVTPIVPDDPFPGYMPPPLDGIWATAPFLHNGSVPTIELVLNSRARPTAWKRADFDTLHIDEAALGWPFVAVDYAQADAPADERKYIYDTRHFSQSNQGHTFGDHLSSAERRAVIEYLKTL
jgi:mono/diheme cytochrome c family protein